MTLLIKTAFPVHISTVKFANLFKESPYSPVVTFPSFGSEGHCVQPPQGDSFFHICVGFLLCFFLCTPFYLLNQVKTPFVNTLILADHKTYQACYYAHYLSFLGDYTLP